MSQAGKLFNKKNGGAGGGNPAAKVDGSCIIHYLTLISIHWGFFFPFHCSYAYRCIDSYASVWTIHEYRQSELGSRRDAEPDGCCNVVLIEVTGEEFNVILANSY
jgi:hypothetical protein